ncbi:MAG: tripartite tricarboxylate transporter substrate binding protein [Burkholderiales bacterium]|nr:tripartite tricarboxylate transporter substrate binding protein [Burkholderiales bacterium]
MTKVSNRGSLAVLLWIAAGWMAFSQCTAQPYPARPVRVVVPYPPGGGTDILARPLMLRVSERIGQQFLIDNRGGATGMVGTDLVAKAAPDGYTVLLSASPELVLNQHVFKKMAYDVLRDLRPVTQVATTPTIIVSIPSFPGKTPKDVIALARRHPGALTYGTTGVGSPHHLVGEMLRLRGKVELTHVPYKGGGPQVTDTLGGHVIISIFTLPVVTPHVQSGRLRGIAVCAPTRSPAVPQVPTMEESGFRGFDISQWFAVSVPRNTPDEVVRVLYGAVSEALQSPDIRKRQLEQGYEPIGSSPEVYAKYLKDEIDKYGRLIKDTGIVMN